jgi:hypothetical protein
MRFPMKCLAASFACALGATASCGGKVNDGGSGGNAAPYPAFPIDNPKVVDRGGPVLAAPRVVAFFDSDDPNADALVPYLTSLGSSSFWSTTAGEYGVGAIAGVTALQQDLSGISSATSVDDARAFAGSLARAYYETGAAPAMSTATAADGSTLHLDTIFVVFSPTAEQCPLAGFHDEASLSDGSRVAFAIVQRCPDPKRELPLAAYTGLIATHELLEASTDPFPTSAPGYRRVDDAHAAWSFIDDTGGTELADMCESGRVTAIVGSTTVTLEPLWSNAAAAAGHYRCAPSTETTSAPEVLAMPVLADSVAFARGVTTRGIALAPGASATIDVRLASDGPTSGPWFIRAIDVESAARHKPPALVLSLDRAQGENGDVLRLSVTRLRGLDPGAAVAGFAFKLEASLTRSFEKSHVEYGFVGE